MSAVLDSAAFGAAVQNNTPTYHPLPVSPFKERSYVITLPPQNGAPPDAMSPIPHPFSVQLDRIIELLENIERYTRGTRNMLGGGLSG